MRNVLAWKGEHDAAIAEFERAIKLNPNFTDWRFTIGLVLAGEFARAVQVAETHMRADPFYIPMASGWLGATYYLLKRYSEAPHPLREWAAPVPSWHWAHVWLAATYAQLGHLGEGRKEAAEVLRIWPSFTIDGTAKRLFVFKDPSDADHLFNSSCHLMAYAVTRRPAPLIQPVRFSCSSSGDRSVCASSFTSTVSVRSPCKISRLRQEKFVPATLRKLAQAAATL